MPEKLAELASGTPQCFTCEEVGHISRNCPKRQRAKAPNVPIGAGSVRFKHLEELADHAREVDMEIHLGAVGIETDAKAASEGTLEPEQCTLMDGSLPTAAGEFVHAQFLAHFEPQEVADAGIELEDRFSIWCTETTVEVTDRLLGKIYTRTFLDSYEIPLERLEDPNWSVSVAIQEEWNRWVKDTPPPDWAGGFPDCRTEYNTHPALYWMRAGLQIFMQENYPHFTTNAGLLQADPCKLGYMISSQVTDEKYTCMHSDVHTLGFDVMAYTAALTEDHTEEELQFFTNLGESRRRRRWSLMLNSVRTAGHRGPKKSQETSADVIPAVERTAMKPKDFNRIILKPVIVLVHVNGHRARALLDTGSMGDFMSTTLVDQLGLKTEVLVKPLALQLAVHRSRSKINHSVTVEFAYQEIKCPRRFDVANLDNYDLILGTPFLFQHQVAIGLNPLRVSIGSRVPVDIRGEDTAVVTSAAADLLDDELEKLREQLRAEAGDLCQDGTMAELPPLWEINHLIPLIDESKIYSWRPSKCPEALKPVWAAKKRAYLASGRWQMASGVNTSPMLILKKPSKGEDDPIRIRTVIDKCEQNANTQKLAAPLPDIDGILRNVVKHKYRSLIDGKDAYKQIRVIPEYVPRTLFTTPDGTMVSLVLQQGDINGPTTYQTVMNHIFAPYIGVFMDVYLDDIVIYSDTIEDHMKHIRIVFDVLQKHKFYLGADKMNFFMQKLWLLGHLIDEHGIAMDPHKVESVRNWKVPTNKSLVSSFLGAVGFLAPDCEGIRIPMGVLAQLTSSARTWNWTDMHQRAFEQVKDIVHKWCNSRRTALDYSEGAQAINLVMDASLTGVSGYICQGDDVLAAKVIMFWSGKFNSAQQNYPVHEQELLAIVESLKRFHHLLYGTSFRICMDHKSLEHLMKQKNLSPRQHRWMDVLNEFRYKVHYIPGEMNVLADALSCLYSDEPAGIMRATSEYVGRDGSDDEHEDEGVDILRPVYTGTAALLDVQPRRSACLGERLVLEGAYHALH